MTITHETVFRRALVTLAACIFCVALTVKSAEYYVCGRTGDDGNAGTDENPFKTPSSAARKLGPGDTLIIRGGRYHDSITTSGGNPIPGKWQAPDNPVTIRAADGETVVFDGTVALKDISEGTWQRHKEDIYKIKLTRDIWQLFDDGEVQTSARWPNAFWHDGSIWSQNNWASMGDDSYLKNREYIDADTKPFPHCDIAKAGFDATGALAILNISNFDTYCEVVTEHGKGNPRFRTTFNKTGTIQALPIMRGPDKGGKMTREFRKGEGRLLPIFNLFFLECSLELLDAPTEWFYDKDTKWLYYYPMDGKSPEGRDVRGKVQTYAFDLWSVKGVVLRCLDFFGTTIAFRGRGFQNPKDACTHVTVEDCSFRYPSYSRRMLGEMTTPQITMLATNQGRDKTIWNPHHYTVRNCTFYRTDGCGIWMSGAENVIENCLFKEIDYSVIDPSSEAKFGKQMTFRGNDDTVQIHQSPGIHVSRVTVDTAGSAHSIANAANVKGHKSPRTRGDKKAKFSVISYCRVIRGGLLQAQDGANFHIWQFNSDYGTFDHCWAQDSTKWGFRFDGNYAPDPNAYEYNTRLDHCRASYCVAWNMRRDNVFTGKGFVPYGSGGLLLKGDWHYIYHDLGLGDFRSFTVQRKDGGNAHSKVYNNLARELVMPSEFKPPEGEAGNNLGDTERVDPYALLRDPQNLDFRPRAGTPLVDAGKFVDGVTTDVVGDAPDIGPYEYGTRHYWIPGYQAPGASTPIPPDGTRTAEPALDLMWLEGYKARSHTVHFGKDRNTLRKMGEFTESNICPPGELLAPGATYCWRVDTVDRFGKTVIGPVWAFTVKMPPPESK